MADPYQLVAFLLTALLLPAFGHLYLRFRDSRTLLWFLGFLLAIVRMLTDYKLGPWNFYEAGHPWMATTGEAASQLGSALFLASLSPARFRLGRLNVLYVIPFVIPLMIFTFLLDAVFRGVVPAGPLSAVFSVLGLLAVVVGFFWGIDNESTPPWLGGTICGAAGVFGFWLLITKGPAWSLTSVEFSMRMVTALLVIMVFRRLSPGVLLTAAGFTAWSLTIFQLAPEIVANSQNGEILIRFVVMGKVVAALGMIVLALEDQLSINHAAQKRERRARLELEAYSNLVLSRRRIEDFDNQAEDICQTVVKHSRFAQAALLLRSARQYHVAGAAGFSPAIVKALDTLASRIPGELFLARGSAPSAVGQSQTVRLDLEPWMEPGDDLKRLQFTSALAVPMAGRTVTEGALLLAGMRVERGKRPEPLRADDLLPVEMLIARLQSVRSQTMMLEKLVDSEKFAGLGQLASTVTQQFNNPLTVILGYASLLEEKLPVEAPDRRGVEAILSEARRMRATLDSLSRVAHAQSNQIAAISVSEMLADLEELYRSEFLRRSIEFRVNVASTLPRVLCNAQQLRQAVLHCLQFSMDAVEREHRGRSTPPSSSERAVRIDATVEGNRVQILVAHSGPAFSHPERAFDPFVSAQAAGETAGLGLSFCATLLRDNNGHASAVNLDPRGAAIILELQAA